MSNSKMALVVVLALVGAVAWLGFDVVQRDVPAGWTTAEWAVVAWSIACLAGALVVVVVAVMKEAQRVR